MFTHRQVWDAIDQIAEEHGMTASGLAKRAGLDSTTFNKSKRISPDGRERWPSTESVSKILRVTGEPIDQFAALVDKSSKSRARRLKTVPLIGFAQAGRGGLFDDGGFPAFFACGEINIGIPDAIVIGPDKDTGTIFTA